MKYRYLGNSGLLVSRVCLGTMTFGTKGWGCGEKESIDIVNSFIDKGGNFIDTADMYSAGTSEEFVGKAIAKHKRDHLVVATKCWFRTHPSANAKGTSRKHIIEACENSLKRLKTDYIDLYQMHGPDLYTPVEETMRTLETLVQSGKVRYIGCSNLYGWQIVKANAANERWGRETYISGQYLYNLVRRDIEREILPACQDQGMGVICWAPLASGFLTGKYAQTPSPDKGSRMDLRKKVDVPRYWNERGFRIVKKLKAISKRTRKTPAELSLAWLLASPGVTSVIAGAKSVAQLKTNLGAGKWDMPTKIYEELDQVSTFDHGYPREWMDKSFPGTLNINP